ncbi:MAG: 8-amino-7-oxononanoate synthase, partial [Phyllobacteriaceae bacterium]|nr:8-amino-7-oxononanoate synthase [Phyllobacteriaceae bacterium]
MSRTTSFEAFVERRARLAGRALLEGLGSDNPWFVEVDALRRSVEARGRDFVSFGNYDYL